MNNMKITVFMNVLEDILAPSSVVQFEQTRAQPLVPYNTFVMENKFNYTHDLCFFLLQLYP